MTEVTAPDLPPLDGDSPVAPLAADGAPPVKAKKARKKKEVDPNAPPKAPKAPKVKSAYARKLDATISIVEDKPFGGRGQRLDWYGRVVAAKGKTVKEFLDGNQGIVNGKGNAEPPGGWLRFFVEEGFVTLEGGTEAAPAAEAAPAEAPAAEAASA